MFIGTCCVFFLFFLLFTVRRYNTTMPMPASYRKNVAAVALPLGWCFFDNLDLPPPQLPSRKNEGLVVGMPEPSTCHEKTW